jgi:antibiotic biosynthesis monooxygenase (ABM) superfamily enzyme
MKQPPKWKFAVMVWIAIYPAITMLQYLIGDKLVRLPIPIRTLILTGILVPFMIFVLLPILRRLLGSWLTK